MVPNSPDLLNMLLGGEGSGMLTPPRALVAAAAVPPQPRTLHTAGGRPELRPGMCTAEALAALGAWPAGLFDAAELTVATDESGGGGGGGDARRAADLLVGQLRRDMMLACPESPSGPMLVVMGLLVAVEVEALRTVRGGKWSVTFLARGGGEAGELRMKASVGATLTTPERDLLYAMGPALATFLHAHGIGTRQQLLDAAAAEGSPLQKRAGRRPRLPECVLAPALSRQHVGRRLVEARSALQRCGYPVPALEGMPLQDGATMEGWVQRAAAGMEATQRKIEEVNELYQRLMAAMQDLRAMTCVGGLLPPVPPPTA